MSLVEMWGNSILISCYKMCELLVIFFKSNLLASIAVNHVNIFWPISLTPGIYGSKIKAVRTHSQIRKSMCGNLVCRSKSRTHEHKHQKQKLKDLIISTTFTLWNKILPLKRMMCKYCQLIWRIFIRYCWMWKQLKKCAR